MARETLAQLRSQLEALRTECDRLRPFEREALELRKDLAALRADHQATIEVFAEERAEAAPVAAKPSRPAYFAAKTELLFIRAYCTAHKVRVAPREAVLAWRALQ